MLFSRSLMTFAVCALLASAEDAKPNLTGNWQLKVPTKSASAITLRIDQKGNVIHLVKTLTSTDGKEQKLEFSCATDGKECDAGGTKISLWFDGKSLVEMDAGETVSKISMSLEGVCLKFELSHIFPDGDPETYVLGKI